MAYTVYCHTNKVNGKKYFGITRQRCKTRWQGGNGYSSNPYFSAAIKKYGWDGFTHEIIAQGVSKQEACELEQYLIRTHDTTNRSKGYNISIGGEFGNLGRKYSDAEKAKMSDANSNLPTDGTGGNVWYDILTVRQSNDSSKETWGYGFQLAVQTTTNANMGDIYVRAVNGGATPTWGAWRKLN